MIIYLIKLTLILIFNTCVSIYYINSDCCCKKEPQANNMLRNESCCKSCKDNKSLDNNNKNSEIKRNINSPKHNKLNNKNNDDLIERNEEGGEGEKKKKDDKKKEENKIKLEEEQKRIEEENKIKLEEEQKRIEEKNKIKLEEQPEEQPEEQQGEEEEQVGGEGEEKKEEEKKEENKDEEKKKEKKEEKKEEENKDEEKKEEEKEEKKEEENKDEEKKEEKKEENKDEEKKVVGKDDKKDDENKIKLEKEKLEKERIEREKQEKEKLEKERIEREKQEKENLERERIEKEKQEKEKKEKEEKERIEKEEAEKKKKEVKESKKECTNKLDSVLDENKDFLYYLENQTYDAVHTEEIINYNKDFLKNIKNLKDKISEEIGNAKSQDKINDINKSIQNLEQRFKFKLMLRIRNFYNRLDQPHKNEFANDNKEVNEIVKIKYDSKDMDEKEKETNENNKKLVAEKNNAEKLFKLYKEILDLNIEVQKERYKNLERQNEEKYKEGIDTLKYLIEMLNDINNEILKYDTNCDEHYMTTAPKNIYQKGSDINKVFKNLENICKDNDIKIENIPKYNDFINTNNTVMEKRRKIEEIYFDKKKTYLSEDNSRRSEIFMENNNLTKYTNETTTDVKRSTYVQNLYNVPFLSDYHGVGNVFIPFAFELTKDYKEIFPKKMIDEVEKELKEHKININENFHIFFCYQYIAEILDRNKKLLFRPHYFIAKSEIDEKYNTLLKEGKNAHEKASYKGCTTYNEIQKFNPNKNKNTCIFYDSEHCIINEDIDNFSVHDGDLSHTIPMVDLIPKDENKINKTYVYYSFVLEHDKKIAALTIHFLCFPKTEECNAYITDARFEQDFYEKNNTIGSAINFATANGDTEVVEFLNQITKK